DQGRGGIRMESEQGRGNAFHAYFPAMPERLPAIPELQASLIEPAAPAGSVPNRGTILVVEDEENIRHMVSSMLTSQGYRVLEAGGAREADYIHENHEGEIDVLLTDVIMPGRSGREIARDFRRLRPGIRIVFMSGYSDEGLLQGMESSHAVLLEKPFTASELLRKLAEAEEMAGAKAGI
ncbi:MAG TPA: response regulator, partial [Fibrobacteria bacterium]|nr:response regulator [Fibrobacteria bacterium]